MPTSKERPTDSHEEFSNKDFYGRAISALLRKEAGKHHDGYRVAGRLTDTAHSGRGRWTLTDKYSYESSAYDATLGSKVCASEQRRLQRTGQSVLYLQLQNQERESLGYYHAFWPHEVRPGGELDERLHANDTSRDRDFVFDHAAADLNLYCTDEVIDPFPYANWPDNQPHIYREVQLGGAHLVSAVTKAHTDPYLQQIYTELLFR